MSEHNAPHDTANALGITPATLRRWCEYHAAYLSSGANPLAGQARRFSGRDLEVLRHCKQLRAQGLTVANINEQLAGLTFAEIDTDAAPIAPESLLAIQEGQHSGPGLIVVVDDHETRLALLEASVSEDRHRQRDGVVMFTAGFLAACGLFVLLLLLFLVRHWL